MRTTLLVLAAALSLVLALAPSRAAADGWQLRVGAEYDQSNTWRPEGTSSRVPRFDLDLGLVAGGSLGGRGLVDYTADGQYRRVAVNGNDSVENHLSYGLRSTFFAAPASPVVLGGFAQRRDESFTTEGTAAGSLVGNTYGGDLQLRATSARPGLTAAYVWNRDDSDTIALGKTQRTLQSLTGTTTFGSSAFSYNASYRGTFSEGTFATDRYDDHRVEGTADTNIAANTKLRFQSSYFQRDTPALSAINARQGSESVSALLMRAPVDGLQHNASYSWAHAAQQTAAVTLDRVQHHLSYGLGGPIAGPEWTLRGAVDASYDEDRIDSTVNRSASQSLSSTLSWRRQTPESVVDVHGGPTIGVLEPQGQSARMGWGATSGISHSRSGSVRTTVGYDLSFTRDVGSDQGWSFRQSASGSADMRLGLGALNGTLMAAAERRENPIFGTSAFRNLTAIGTWRVRTSDVSLQLGYQDGTSGQIPSGTVGDALFLASAYNSHTGFAQLGAGTTLGRFGTRARVRFSTVDLPDRPAFNETQLFGAIDYAYGALRIALEDTYVLTDVAGGQLRTNQFMVKAYRVFGSRF